MIRSDTRVRWHPTTPNLTEKLRVVPATTACSLNNVLRCLPFRTPAMHPDPHQADRAELPGGARAGVPARPARPVPDRSGAWSYRIGSVPPGHGRRDRRSSALTCCPTETTRAVGILRCRSPEQGRRCTPEPVRSNKHLARPGRRRRRTHTSPSQLEPSQGQVPTIVIGHPRGQAPLALPPGER